MTGGGRLRIGVDLGGTKIEAVALGEDGAELNRLRRPSPQGDYGRTIAAILSICDDVSEALTGDWSETRIGVGAPGSTSPATGLMRNANSTWLNGEALAKDLAAAAPWPVRLANDADCLALSEAADGAGAGARTVFGVIIGTGVGGGFVSGGRLHTGANGVGGEWGHAPAPEAARDGPSRACWCGRRDCVETWLSGPALARCYEERSGAAATGAEVAARAASGERVALAALESYADRLAAGLGMVANIVDPEVFVLGGGLSNLPGVAPKVEERLKRHIFSDSAITRVRRAVHGDSSGVLGAARLWPSEGD